MPTAPTIAATWKVEVFGQTLGHATVLTFHVKDNGVVTLTQAIANTIAGAVRVPLAAAIANFCTGTSWTSCTVTDVRTAAGPRFFGTFAVLTGTAVSDPLPAATCAVISLGTAKRGPRYRGRIFLPGMGEGASTSGTGLTAGTVANMQTLGDAWRAALGTTVPYSWAIASRLLGTSEPITGCIARTRFGTQRRRQKP